MKVTHTHRDIVEEAYKKLKEKYPLIVLEKRELKTKNFGDTFWFTLHFNWREKNKKNVKGMRKANGRYTGHACWHVYYDFVKLLAIDCYYKSSIISTEKNVNKKLIEDSNLPDEFWDYHLYHRKEDCNCETR